MAHLESSLIKTDNTALAHTAATLSYFRVDRKQQRGRDEIRLPSSPVKFLVLHVGSKMEFVRWIWGLTLIKIVLIVMDLYSIEIEI